LEALTSHAWKQYKSKGITLLLRQLQWGKENAQDIKIVISQAQLDSALTEPILEETKTWTPYIEEVLIRHIRERLNYLEGSIAMEDVWCPTLQREGDVSIMQSLSRLPGVTKGELKKANHCRKWMKVITIAELVSIDGKYNNGEPNPTSDGHVNLPQQKECGISSIDL
jgi:hypothetical protein